MNKTQRYIGTKSKCTKSTTRMTNRNLPAHSAVPNESAEAFLAAKKSFAPCATVRSITPNEKTSSFIKRTTAIRETVPQTPESGFVDQCEDFESDFERDFNSPPPPLNTFRSSGVQYSRQKPVKTTLNQSHPKQSSDRYVSLGSQAKPMSKGATVSSSSNPVNKSEHQQQTQPKSTTTDFGQTIANLVEKIILERLFLPKAQSHRQYENESSEDDSSSNAESESESVSGSESSENFDARSEKSMHQSDRSRLSEKRLPDEILANDNDKRRNQSTDSEIQSRENSPQNLGNNDADDEDDDDDNWIPASFALTLNEDSLRGKKNSVRFFDSLKLITILYFFYCA